MKNAILSFVGLSLILVTLLFYVGNTGRMVASYGEITDIMASLFFAKGISVSELQEKYAKVEAEEATEKLNKVKILIVPGHFPDKGGTSFGGLNERDAALFLGRELVSFLKKNEKFEPILARDERRFAKEIGEYVLNNKEEISKWREEHESEMQKLIKEGKVKSQNDQTIRNSLNKEDALYLYGINKWANENDIGIVLNIHLNDYPRKNINSPGKYSGFTIFVPESQYGNYESSNALAEYLSARLGTFLPMSNLPKEGGGVVEDQDLIALGRFNTAKTASVLIEYGYIYEPFFRTKDLREVILKEMAHQTYLAIEEFFGEIHEEITFLNKNEKINMFNLQFSPNTDALKLQLSMLSNGFYPPNGKTLEDCPVSGIVGDCTKESLKFFQKISGLNQTGILDKKTLDAFNNLSTTTATTTESI